MRGRKKGFAAEQESERARAPCKVDSRGEEEEEFHTFDSKQDLWRQEQPRKRKGKNSCGGVADQPIWFSGFRQVSSFFHMLPMVPASSALSKEQWSGAEAK